PAQWHSVNVVDARFVRAVHHAGLPVHVWTINDERTMATLLDLGVNGVMTDRPRLLRSLLDGRGQWFGSEAGDAPLGARHNGAWHRLARTDRPGAAPTGECDALHVPAS